MTDTDVAFLLHYRPCPYNRHDLYLPSIPASLQTLGRFECAVASAPAPHGLRITCESSHPYLSFLRAFWTSTKKLDLSSSSHLSTVASVFVLAHPPWFLPPLLLLVAGISGSEDPHNSLVSPDIAVFLRFSSKWVLFRFSLLSRMSLR